MGRASLRQWSDLGDSKCAREWIVIVASSPYLSCPTLPYPSSHARQVSDAKPVRPAWGSLAAGAEGVATAITAWGSLVVLGDADGNLNRWDTATGRITTLATPYVRPRLRR